MAISEKYAEAQLLRLARRLRRARLAANLTQKALAQRTGVALKTIGNAEDHGQISLETLVRLLDGLGRLDELESLLQDRGPSPVDLLRRKGKERRRASARKTGDDGEEWQW